MVEKTKQKSPRNKKRYYLAHPIKDRLEIRAWEKEIEKQLGIELVNPFYDAAEIGNIKQVDSGEKGVYDSSFDSSEIVEGDLELIRNADGMVAIITKNISVGTNMEIFFNSYVLKRPTHIIVESEELRGHSWLRYMSVRFAGKIYKNRKEFAEKFLGKDDGQKRV